MLDSTGSGGRLEPTSIP